MAVFDELDPERPDRLDWNILKNGAISLYFDPGILEEACGWFREQNYRFYFFDCTRWVVQEDFYDAARDVLSLPDERLLRFFLQGEKTPLLVQALRADDLGSLTIELSADHILTMFPDDSLDAEYWRFFQTDADPDLPHFVVTDQGIEKGRRKKGF